MAKPRKNVDVPEVADEIQDNDALQAVESEPVKEVQESVVVSKPIAKNMTVSPETKKSLTVQQSRNWTWSQIKAFLKSL